ncbi:PQQ-dependent sugar dehydrogenase [Nocardioides sp. LML1-1-1.1]|uniref:PQQ-dependent sugar dehydrogenase n=1 Tax=Nocardioides sp. LML1-1-1.1 TaxID=3135248 RepID=UPI003435CD12
MRWLVRWKWPVLGILGALLVAGGVAGYRYGDGAGWWVHPSVADAPDAEPASVETVAKGLAVPWDLAFLPDGSALVTERITGRLRRVSPSGQVSEVRTFEEIDPDSASMGGLQGLALSPSYAEDGWVYVYYTGREDSRVVRFRLGSTADPEPVLTGIPAGNIHNGGRIRFGPDGMLYVTTGEADRRAPAQDRADLGGKILRVTPEGRPAPGNPDPASPVYAWGWRDPQGLAWDEQGTLYATEFGFNKLDELNVVEPGQDYGWPEAEGPADDDDLTDPIATWRPEDASPSGMTFHDGKIWIACLRGERLYRIDPDGSADSAEQLLAHEYGRLRLVTEAPDGSLWVLTNDRKDADGDLVLRLVP